MRKNYRRKARAEQIVKEQIGDKQCHEAVKVPKARDMNTGVVDILVAHLQVNINMVRNLPTDMKEEWVKPKQRKSPKILAKNTSVTTVIKPVDGYMMEMVMSKTYTHFPAHTPTLEIGKEI